MIKRDSVRRVIEAARVEEVVGDYVTLKRSGANLSGLCPFHNEKSGSFTVSPAKGFYKCFGCGKSGDSVNFLMDHSQLTFADAIRSLAKRYNIPIEEQEFSPEMQLEQQATDSLFIVNEFAKKYYETQLWDTDLGKSVGLSYFKQRGFTEDTIRKFGLGYAPTGKGSLVEIARLKGFEMPLLRKLGLMTEKERDFFYNRVMFPIHNVSGKVAAMAGRVIVKDEKGPKYINSPESEIYSKSKLLYGIFQARQSVVKLDECLLVEGYTDVISLHQAGIENVVASSGTALTADQLRLVKRFTPNLTIIYDGDAAGIKAAVRGLELAIEADLNVKIVLLPAPEDPDSFIQKVGALAFRAYVNKEKRDFIRFKAQLALEDAGDDPIKRSNFIREIVELLGLMLDPIKRATYVRDIASLMKMEESLLTGEINKVITRNMRKKMDDQERVRAREEGAAPGAAAQELPEGDGEAELKARPIQHLSRHEFQERDIARILVQHGAEMIMGETPRSVAFVVLQAIQDVLDSFENKGYFQIVQAATKGLQKEMEITPSFFISYEDRSVSQLAIDLMSSPWQYSPTWETKGVVLQMQPAPELNFKMDAKQAILRFRLRKVEWMLQNNLADLKRIEESKGDYAEIEKVLRVRQKLIEIRNSIAKDLGTVVL